MDTTLIMGNTAAAYGALAAGVNVVCGYPGTPSSELLESASSAIKAAVDSGALAPEDAPHIEWSVNEKAALELAYGASLCGARALVTMKQVGLNVAADPLMTITYLGVKGGLVLFVTDDPGPISSQTEQDTRQFAQFAKVPLLDASSPEELSGMMTDAFGLSERHGTPVIVRATTRVCHGSAPLPEPPVYAPHAHAGFTKDPRWVIFPPLAYKAHASLPGRFKALLADEAFKTRNFVVSATKSTFSEIGIVAGGISWAYVLDALERLGLSGAFDLLKIGAPFPFDDELAADFLETHKSIVVFEELEATIERELLRVAGSKQLQKEISGKLTGTTAFAGENSVALITQELICFLDLDTALPEDASAYQDLFVPRPPVLCAGCPHRASFFAVKKALRGQKATYSGDIGCYTLGNALPLEMTDTCVCMGAGFTVPQGMQWVDPDVPHIGFVGDSTFFASGITGVVNAVYNKTPVTLVVLDNSLTAMTGSQPHPGTGIRMSYDATPTDAENALSIPSILEALGVSPVLVANPFDLENAIEQVRSAVAEPHVSAVVFKAPCINVSAKKPIPQVVADACTACRVCIESIGCPALTLDNEASSIKIDPELCFGCDLCIQTCPFNAIESTGHHDE